MQNHIAFGVKEIFVWARNVYGGTRVNVWTCRRLFYIFRTTTHSSKFILKTIVSRVTVCTM